MYKGAVGDSIFPKVCAGKFINEIWNQMKTVYASGIGLPELASNPGVPEETVLSRSKREGWTQKIQSAPFGFVGRFLGASRAWLD